jgi:hypothetical protein
MNPLTGITNRGDFYSPHYLEEQFTRDLKPLLDRWKQREADEPAFRSPQRVLDSLATPYFDHRAQAEQHDALGHARRLHARLLDALGYPRTPVDVQLDDGAVLPLAHEARRGGRAVLWVIEGAFCTEDGADPLDQPLDPSQLTGDPDATELVAGSIREILDRHVFRQDDAPSWVLFLGGSEVVLTHAHKWPEGRMLAFDLDALFARRQAKAFRVLAGLLHRDALVPEDGTSLHDTLSDNDHKHASGVSTKLREAAQEAIELLGNEVVHAVRTQRPRRRADLRSTHPDQVWWTPDRDGLPWTFAEIEARPDRLTEECLLYLYRLIFLFYAESRSEDVGVAPMRSEAYRRGYSLEHLRDLELVDLTTAASQDGFYLHETLVRLFRLVNEGYPTRQLTLDPGATPPFTLPGLHSRLFDPGATPILAGCKLRNVVLQRILRRLSLTKADRRGRRRISYASLGINQLGAVYEGLLSYTGFFAKHPLLEVANAKENTSPSDDMRTHFVPLAHLDRYDEAELVKTRGPDGRPTGQRVEIPRATFLYRLAGRDREKSASYYTPQVLTECLVLYTLRERIGQTPDDPDWVAADDLLTLTICEPAMGSGAFLNEVVDQLAKAYLERKAAELGPNDDPEKGPLVPIPAERYPRELQRVKAHIAAHQCYGVDLNPLAAELGKVSLWLNVLHPGAPAPFFDARIATGNSLVGARKAGYRTALLVKASKKGGPSWLDQAPEPLTLPREDDVVWHFLVPQKGMAAFDGDKVVKKLRPEDVARIKAWRKALNTTWKPPMIRRLRDLSAIVDRLWTAHVAARRAALEAVDERVAVWPAPARTAVSHEDALRQAWRAAERENRAGQRLKEVMDYWGALWFWPVLESASLPSREEWLDDLEAILTGPLAGRDADDASGARRRVAAGVAARERFVHWAWQFPEVLEDGGFDVIVGNPPWLKVQWNEQGILSDLDARMDIRRMSAKQAADARAATLADDDALKAYLGEFVSLTGLKAAVNDVANYPLLQGVQTNLYKAFMVQGATLAESGALGILHQKGVFDDPRGGSLRRHLQRRLKFHLHFINKLLLFQGVEDQKHYEMSVFGRASQNTSFRHVSNLLHPRTLLESDGHDGIGVVPGIKTAEGDWDLRGHRSRIVDVDAEALGLFARLYDPPGTPAVEARLPVVHSQEILSVLRKLARAPRTLGDLDGEYFSTVCFDETYAQRDGTIRRETTVPASPAEWVVSGPHFYVGNPFNKSPNENCRHNQDYSVVDLMAIPADYLPRTNYVPACTPDEYEARTPHWDDVPVTGFYRHIHRKMVAPTGERTLVNAILPPGPAHIITVFALAFRKLETMLTTSAMCSSIPLDFFLKSSGKSDALGSTAALFPIPNTTAGTPMRARALRLNCVTNAYAPLWSETAGRISAGCHTKLDPRLPDWSHLTAEWTWDSPLRSPYARRQALVELDALAALSLGLTADELCLIYRVQFPVLFQYEQDTWYDQRGRIVFTNNRGLNGVGLSRKEWDELKGAANGPLQFLGVPDPPAWAHDALGPYEAPFDRCDREADMRQAYEVFVSRGIEPALHGGSGS